CVPDEHSFDGLQIILGREVHYGKIFVIELTVLLGRIAVTLDQMVKQVAVGLDVTIEIHADETVQLQKSRIHIAHHARLRKRHFGNDIAPEPLGAAGLRERIDTSWIDACIYWAAHQHHRAWHARVLDRFHASDGSHHGHRRLAHRDDMNVTTEKMQN